MICPYCEMDISISAIDAEDGFCPECGTAIDPSLILPSEDEIASELLDDDDDDFVVPLGGGK